jgi:putative ABC transport system permease protein
MNDIRFAFRQLAKSPGFTVVALLTLAIGIGACTAIFTVVNGVLLRPLDFPEPSRLVRLYESRPPEFPQFSCSVGNFSDWQKQSTSFSSLAATYYSAFSLTGSGDPVRLNGQRVTTNYLSTLGARPALGRDFLPAEGAEGRGDVAILGEGLWSEQFGRRADIIGQVIHLDGNPVTIVGVMPWEFHGPAIMLPTAFTADNLANHGSHFMQVTGRLKPAVSVAQARAELAAIAGRLEKLYPVSNLRWTVLVKPMLEDMVGNVRPQLLALFAAVGFLLFIGCANVANLLLVRAAGRSREMAVRAAVGASRTRIVRQLLVENIVLAIMGGILGTVAAYWGLHLLLALSPYGVPRARELSVDRAALAFSFGVALLTGIGFGLAPAFQAARVDLNTVLKDAGRGSGEGRHRHRLRNTLVVAELTIAVILLVGAGLLMRSFIRLVRINPGFNAESAFMVNVTLPDKKYGKDEQAAGFAGQATEKLAQIPGVTFVGATQSMPFYDDYVLTFFKEGEKAEPGREPSANYYCVSPGYFKAMGIPLLKGREFTASDSSAAPRVAVVSAAMATRFYPNEDPIGKRINVTNPQGTWSEIVGVVGDVKQYGLNSEAPAANYEPLQQHPFQFLTFVLRTSGGAPGLSASVRSAISSIDPDQPIDAVKPLTELVRDSVSRERFGMNLFLVFSGAALLLATIGIYGVMAYSVSQRTGEIGVRMALGAQPRDVLLMIVGQGAFLIAIGIGAGLVGSLILTRFMASMLYGVGAADPLTLAGAALTLALAAFAACLLSARRATLVQPMVALRGN